MLFIYSIIKRFLNNSILPKKDIIVLKVNIINNYLTIYI